MKERTLARDEEAARLSGGFTPQHERRWRAERGMDHRALRMMVLPVGMPSRGLDVACPTGRR